MLGIPRHRIASSQALKLVWLPYSLMGLAPPSSHLHTQTAPVFSFKMMPTVPWTVLLTTAWNEGAISLPTWNLHMALELIKPAHLKNIMHLFSFKLFPFMPLVRVPCKSNQGHETEEHISWPSDGPTFWFSSQICPFSAQHNTWSNILDVPSDLSTLSNLPATADLPRPLGTPSYLSPPEEESALRTWPLSFLSLLPLLPFLHFNILHLLFSLHPWS